jgi:hypothetical protein
MAKGMREEVGFRVVGLPLRDGEFIRGGRERIYSRLGGDHL